MTRSAPRIERRTACILLAAGGSRRLGFPKQLVRRRTLSLLAHALVAARGALPSSPVIVVLGAEAQRLRLVARRALPSVVVVYNAHWENGLASSLNVGLAAVPKRTRAILVTLVDQPNVDERSLKRLLRAWRRRRGVAAAASYAGRPGAPAVLPRRYWRAIRALRGDEGARALLRGSEITTVDMPEAELDVDTRADVARL